MPFGAHGVFAGDFQSAEAKETSILELRESEGLLSASGF
jgi:hypothetical protein